MAYQVDRFNGTFFVSVEDGTIDNTTDIRLVGKNYAGYGEVQNENFLHLLESFANTSPPPKAIKGQIWFDSSVNKLKFYDGSKFRVAGGSEVASIAPSGLTQGDFWWDTSSKQLKVWSGTDYITVGPIISPDLGESAIVTQVVKDTLNNNHSIIRIQSAGKTMMIVSRDEFTLNPVLNPIEDFTVIKKGLTLLRTPAATGVTTDDHWFWGTASNSVKLGGYPASEYVKKGDNTFNEEVWFKDPGFYLGDGKDLRVWVENSDQTIIQNTLGNDITVRLTVQSGTDERNVAVFRSTGIAPGTDAFFDLGTALSRWNNVYATTTYSNLIGDVTGNVTGRVTGNVVAEDSTVLINASNKQLGDISASLRGTLTGNVIGGLNGTATNAEQLNFISPSVTLPESVDQTSIVVRSPIGEVTASRFIGITDRADRIKIDNSAVDTDLNYRTAKTTVTANSIVARDASADVYANLFQGTATAARYADLAEKYLADADYDVGTVVAVGGEKEVTACSAGQRALGVVSRNPAFMMNKDLEGGTYIALKGRVPVKVTGPVYKGQRLIAGQNGTAVGASGAHVDIFAIALESNTDLGSAIIEAVVL